MEDAGVCDKKTKSNRRLGNNVVIREELNDNGESQGIKENGNMRKHEGIEIRRRPKHKEIY